MIAPRMTAWSRSAFMHRLILVAFAGALVYGVLLGGTSIGEVDVSLRTLNAILGGAFIAWYATRIASDADLIDRITLVALLLFVAACLFSAYPRQSLDAAVTATALAATFHAARRLLIRDNSRRVLALTLVLLSVVMSSLFASLWLRPLWAWWVAVDFRTLPPLGTELSGYVWGHRHDVALLLLMLYPAWWIESPSRARKVAAVVFGAIAVPLVLVDGSRTVWVAIAVATAALALPSLRQFWNRPRSRRRIEHVFLLVAGVSTAAVLGLLAAERAVDLESLGWRGELWRSLVDAWTERPATGLGPGSFAWILQSTDYFDANSWAPRHPDNALIHMLAEGGLIGLAGMGVAALGLAVVIARTTSAAARWSLTLFVVASIGGNPTNFSFLLIVLIAWAAYAVPATDAPVARESSRALRSAMAGCLTVLAIAHVAMTSAHLAYEDAREAATRDDLTGALASLDRAMTLDPGMDLYLRESGIARYLTGDLETAVANLARAATRNPSDDVTWRALALARRDLGDHEGAAVAVQAALDAQRSDPTNLMLAVTLATDRDQQKLELVSEIVHAWPQVVFAHEWRTFVPLGVPPDEVARMAFERARRGEQIPDRVRDQSIWLSAFAGWTGPLPSVVSEFWGEPLSAALRSAITCTGSAATIENDVPDAAARAGLFWLLHFRDSMLKGAPDEDDLAQYATITGTRIADANTEAHPNPLNENEPLSADTWGYRRSTLRWNTSPVALPSITAGLNRWALDPVDSAVSSGISPIREGCGPATAQPPDLEATGRP